MRILWVKPGGLWPPNTGGRLRSLNMIKELAREHHVTVLTTRSKDEEVAPLFRSLSSCEHVQVYDHSPPKRSSARFLWALGRSWFSRSPVDIRRHTVPNMKREAARQINSGGVDLCIADFLYAMPNIEQTASVPVVLFEHNVEYMIWERMANVEQSRIKRILLEIEWRKIRLFESESCRTVNLTIAVSKNDCNVLKGISPSARITYVPTGVDLDYFMPLNMSEDDNELVFFGSMDWRPNEDAIMHFLDTTFPLVRNVIPKANLTVVGRNPSVALMARAERGKVKITGTVEDIREYVAGASVCIVPLRIGSGTRLKIMEALAMGKAVVSTTIGAEGLALTANHHIALADEPQEFANEVIRLMRDRERRKSLGDEGRRLVAERYSWRQVTGNFMDKCNEVIA